MNANLHYHCAAVDGVLAPKAALRGHVTAYAGQPITHSTERGPPEPARSSSSPGEAPWRSPAVYLWVALLARIYDCLPSTCSRCGAPMTLIAFVTEPASVQRVLAHLGLPSEPPMLTPARGAPSEPPDTDRCAPRDSTTPDPVPDCELDQRITW